MCSHLSDMAPFILISASVFKENVKYDPKSNEHTSHLDSKSLVAAMVEVTGAQRPPHWLLCHPKALDSSCKIGQPAHGIQ